MQQQIWSRRRKGWLEIVTRVLLFAIFFYTEQMEPFFREVQPQEYWLYKYPSTPSIVSSASLYFISTFSITTVLLASYIASKDSKRIFAALSVHTMALPLNGIVTNIVKICVGRLRPDYFNRCYGDNYLNVNDLKETCTGTELLILDGRKSFPSGHSSMSFSSLGFVFLFVAAQLGVFTAKGRGQSWRLLVALIPLIIAMLVALSRTCDYHHHWQDVSVGSLIGFLIVYLVYSQYFPSIFEPRCDQPYSFCEGQESSPRPNVYMDKEVHRLASPITAVKTV